MSVHDEYFELVDLYALGRLDDPDLGRIEAHLADGCDLCHARLLEAEAAAADLVRSLPPVAPSELARRRLLNEVRATTAAGPAGGATAQPIEPRARGWMAPLALAASAVLVVGLGAQLRSLEQRLDRATAATSGLLGQVTALRSELEAERAARATLSREVAATRDALDTLTAPGTLPVVLAGQEDAPGAVAKAFVDPANGRLALYVYDLPEPAAGRTYQLWVIVGGKPVSLGVFDVSGAGPTRYEAHELPALEGKITVAVTEEPAGGVPQPTGPMVLVGS